MIVLRFLVVQKEFKRQIFQSFIDTKFSWKYQQLEKRQGLAFIHKFWALSQGWGMLLCGQLTTRKGKQVCWVHFRTVQGCSQKAVNLACNFQGYGHKPQRLATYTEFWPVLQGFLINRQSLLLLDRFRQGSHCWCFPFLSSLLF